MRERVRGLWLGVRLALRAGGWRIPVIVACSLSIAVQPAANAIALRLLVDGTLARDWPQVGGGLAMLAALIGVTFSAYGIRVPLETTVTERASRLFEQDVMRLVAALPTLEAHERPDFADKLDVLRRNSQLLIGAAWTLLSNLSFLVGAGAALGLLAEVQAVLLVLPVFGIPLFIASVRGVRLHDQAVERTAEPLRTAAHLFRVATSPAFGKELRVCRLAGEIMSRHDRVHAAADRELFAADLRGALLSAGAWVVFVTAWAAGIALVALPARAGGATPGDVVLAIAVAGLVQGYVSGAVGMVRDVRQALTMAARYVWLLDFARRFPGDGRPAPHATGDGIVLDRVSFTYPGTDVEVLHDISLRLPAGATVGVVGDNGAGKTTLVKLLLGLYRPTRGRILVNGVDLAELASEGWCGSLAGTFQDFAKLEFQVRESIGAGDLTRVDDDDAVRGAAERVGAADLPPLDQQLGRGWERGIDISGGQWQRIAVARGMMRGHPLVRVLDEPTASLDADAEHALFEQYRRVARDGAATVGAVTVLVSHRFSTVRMADLILVIADGRVAEQGSHDELMRGGGLYAELFQLQAYAYR